MDKSKAKFLKVICSKCKNEQIVFGKASTRVKCNNCGKIIVKPAGGNAKVRAKIEQVIKRQNT
ncbi:MAG: 30S ribosomal protein S27e [Candidatus Pacearchaeota archaeon]